MDYISIALIIFIVLEVSNVIVMFFFNETTIANGVGVFKKFTEQDDPETKDLIKYLIYWVAGTKVIFIALLIVIIFLGSMLLKQVAVVALVLSISLFYWKMFPLAKRIEGNNGIKTKNYSRNLALIIGLFILMFIIALLMTIM